MFERFTNPDTVLTHVFHGNTEKLQKLIRGGCRIDHRETYDPWRTPLDAAAIVGNAACADLLLSGGAPLCGSSIVEAIKVDSRPVLEVFYKHDPLFFRKFLVDNKHQQNPRLNRWLLLFTALDYALSIGSTACSTFLTEVGAPKKEKFSQCMSGHYAPFIKDESFVSFGGVNVDGHSTVTEGYYCAKCEFFI